MKRGTYVTTQQATIHALFLKHRSMSTVARQLGVSQIRVREALVQYERNRLRDQGEKPPPLREMMLGEVVSRFCSPRPGVGGRPAKHVPIARTSVERPLWRTVWSSNGTRFSPSQGTVTLALPAAGAMRLVVTAVEPDAEVHRGFWSNLQAYARRVGAELVVIRLGQMGRIRGDERLRELSGIGTIVVGGTAVEIVGDFGPSQSGRPLDSPGLPRRATWTIVGHPAIQLETVARMRGDGLRMRITTGAVTKPRSRSPRQERRDVGAVIVEAGADGFAHCRHLLADADGNGAFNDLDVRVDAGAVTFGHRAAALVFGDVHHAHLDAGVAAATWGLGCRPEEANQSLIERLRPAAMVFHDVCDFDARNHHDAKDPHRRFALLATGRACVRTEFSRTANFLRESARDWSESIVVQSNHDDALARWLKEADFRQDPQNAEFFLECSLALHRRLAAGLSGDGLFERTLRQQSLDGLPGVRFLATGEGLEIAGVQCGIHGHSAADGKRGSMAFFEGLGIRAVLGHNHRPTTRGGICTVGVCQTELEYARGALTAWAVGHVVIHANGSRQHLIYDGGRFFA
ncbi:hypothetical protein [Sphingomonas beigongshangi]|uniref:hypothetical protein n=1 Tax=Sphingomonas beigongshangi TaxID=2782540 RepID=UPI001AED966F|nr:hypothetical protein [Sphingomonas beigongshangi]